LKLNSDEQTLAENKILLIYILNKIGKPISHNELLELVISISDMNYFYFEQFLIDLIEDKYIRKYQKEDDDIYEITKEGKKALNLTIDTLPGILKLNIDKDFKVNLDEIKDKFSVTAEFSPVSEKEFYVRCKIIENNNIIFDLNVLAGSKEQAQKIVDNWNNKSTDIYPNILELLTKNE